MGDDNQKTHFSWASTALRFSSVSRIWVSRSAILASKAAYLFCQSELGRSGGGGVEGLRVRRKQTIFLASRGWAWAREAGGVEGLRASGVDVGVEDMVENRKRGAFGCLGRANCGAAKRWTDVGSKYKCLKGRLKDAYLLLGS